MKAAIVNPYWDTLGGGERYTTNVVKVLLDKGYKVDIEWPNKDILRKVNDRFNIKIADANVVSSVGRGDGYDVCFWVSDGSIPTLRARNNILHFQIPFKNVKGRTLINKTKLFRINNILCNSMFTKSFIDKEYGVKSTVLYPPVDVAKIKSKRKENIILYVGRFSQLTQSKHQDVLIKVFKKLYDRGCKNWKLILAGGVEVGVNDYVRKLRLLAKGYPVQIIESPSFKTIIDYYGIAKIFWSASGYAVKENVNPEKVEHFGITVVEAMAGGAVPIVTAKGGHNEIIQNNETGVLWIKKRELLNLSEALINNPKLMREMSKKAQNRSKQYSNKEFEINISAFI